MMKRNLFILLPTKAYMDCLEPEENTRTVLLIFEIV